jgi:hypothetical protein
VARCGTPRERFNRSNEVRRGREGGKPLPRSRVLGYDRRVGMAKTEILVKGWD